MDSFDLLIVGSGPAGTAAAIGSPEGLRVAMLDVGLIGTDYGALPTGENLYDLRATRTDLGVSLLGPRFENLHNVTGSYRMPKLKAPGMRFVTDRSESLSPIRSERFDARVSLARGGLANAWGAQCYRYDDQDLESFPIRYEDLRRFYDTLTRHIGVNGTEDDLADAFVDASDLLPPMRTTKLTDRLLDHYATHRAHYSRLQIKIGRPRLAILTREHDGRPRYEYENTEFFKPSGGSIYNPRESLDRLVSSGRLEYFGGLVVRTFEESANTVTIHAEDVDSGELRSFRARRVLLGAGTINTTRIVLASRGDYESRLPILDNPIAYIPLLHPAFIGDALDRQAYTAQLVATTTDRETGERLLGTFYGMSGSLRSDLMFEFPLPFRGQLSAARHVLPAMSLLQLWYPDRARTSCSLRLSRDGALEVEYDRTIEASEAVTRLASAFLRAGFVSSRSLCKFPAPGNSFHYAGTIPMKPDPSPLETDANCSLGGSSRVHVIDGACFSELPAKNHTFTIMANAMRISEIVGKLASAERIAGRPT